MNKVAFASSLLAALYTPVNSLRLTGTPDEQGSTGPILTQPNPLSYHGTDTQYEWAKNFGLHSFWVYPEDIEIPSDSRWDTKDAAAFCKNNVQIEE